MSNNEINEDLGTAWAKFIEVMELKDDPDLDHLIPWWTHVFEFGIFMGRDVFNSTIDNSLKDKEGKLIRKAKAINGTHGATLIKAYKARRYSIRGRAAAPFKKLGQMTYMSSLMLLRYMKEGFACKIQ